MKEPKTNTPTILNVEDDDVSCFLLNEVLADHNIDIIHTKNGNDAIDICKQNGGINLVLMDIKLPDINGFQAMREIKKIRPELPVVAVTAYAFAKDKSDCFKAGCDDYLSKPVDSKTLLNVIDKFL